MPNKRKQKNFFTGLPFIIECRAGSIRKEFWNAVDFGKQFADVTAKVTVQDKKTKKEMKLQVCFFVNF